MQHWRTQNLNASVYILSINWYILSDCENSEKWQHIVTTAGVGAHYRRNVQQYLLILIYTYGTQFIKWRKNEGRSKILNWGRGTMRFRFLLCCVNELEYFWTFNNNHESKKVSSPMKILKLRSESESKDWQSIMIPIQNLLKLQPRSCALIVCNVG